jgi:hypothetical protein
MEIGKFLKEKHGFGNTKLTLAFKCKYNYSGKFIESLLNDEFPELLPIHLKEISEFTGVPIEKLIKLQTPRPEGRIGHLSIPLGRVFATYPVIAKIEIKDLQCLTKK